MGKILIVSVLENLKEYEKIAKEYDLGYEYNDFFEPEVLKNPELQDELIKKYKENFVPEYCTMHGAFMDVLLFSTDEDIREIAKKRMKDSMEMAKKLGARGVVFHTNANPFLSFGSYYQRTVDYTVDYVKKLLESYPDIEIYMENMFDQSPDILCDISEQLYIYNNYGVCFDYAHASISTTDVEEWIARLKNYIKHIHINDNDLIDDLHLAVGDGAIDWDKFFEYYNRYFKDCSMLIETTNPENQIKSIEYMKKYGFFKEKHK